MLVLTTWISTFRLLTWLFKALFSEKITSFVRLQQTRKWDIKETRRCPPRSQKKSLTNQRSGHIPGRATGAGRQLPLAPPTEHLHERSVSLEREAFVLNDVSHQLTALESASKTQRGRARACVPPLRSHGGVVNISVINMVYGNPTAVRPLSYSCSRIASTANWANFCMVKQMHSRLSKSARKGGVSCAELN